MRKILCALITTLCIVSCVLSFNASDVKAYKVNEWAHNGVKLANLYGIIPVEIYNGDYTSNITRLDVAHLIVNAYQKIKGDVKPDEFHFSDTYNDEVVNKICTLGIMNGRNREIFSPSDFLTREEMAKIILSFKAAVNSEKLSLPVNYQAEFSDFAYLSEWAKPYVALAKSSGVFTGYDDNTFRGKDKLSREMAIALVLRCASFEEEKQPEIISPDAWTVASSETNLSVGVSAKGDFELYIESKGIYPYRYCAGNGNGTQVIEIDKDLLEKDSVYSLYAVCNGVFSDAVTFYTDRISVPVGSQKLTEDGIYRISWERAPGVEIYDVRIVERRNSYYKEDIAPLAPVAYSVRWEDHIDVYLNPDRTYEFEITGGGHKTNSTVYTEPVRNPDAAEIKSSYPQTKEEADALMTSIQVPVWKIKNGQKISSTAWLTVHHRIAEKVRLVFEEIYNGPEKFPIKDVGGYAWRGGRSEHNGGTAIDINANENYCIYTNGTVIGSHWKPYDDVYSITPYGDVVKAFEKYGFTWGGDAWRNPKDYMHFSYLGT